MESRENAESTAAAWIARRECDDWSAADQVELDAWIQADMGNRAAWLRLNAVWQQTDRLKTLVTHAAAGAVPAPNELHLPFLDSRSECDKRDAPENLAARRRESARKWARPSLALAASIVVAVAATVWYVIPRESVYQTEIGALQSVPLSDGSRVTLNTNTELRVDVTRTERRIDLEQGEAYFEVAKDPSRPFVVAAGDKRIIAIGTRFSVRREGNEVRVAVTEGRVRVEQKVGQAREVSTKQALAELAAGSVARARSDDLLVLEKSIDEVEQSLSWRVGRLSFDRTALADVVAEFNRYNTRKIIIEDASVAAIRVGGNFGASNIDGFLRLIADDFPIHVTQRDDEIILTRRPPH